MPGSAPDTAEVFAALGDATRLDIVARLGKGPHSIVSLTEGTALTRQAVTKHLYVLEKAGLATVTRRGRTSLWQLERRRLSEAQGLLERLSRQWDTRLDWLSIFVDGDRR